MVHALGRRIATQTLRLVTLEGLPAKANLAIQQGAPFFVQTTVVDPNGYSMNLRDYFVRMEAKDEVGGTLLFQFREGDFFESIPPAGLVRNYYNDSFDLSLNVTQTQLLDFTEEAVYELELAKVTEVVVAYSGSVAVDADNGTGKGRLTASSGTPFSGLTANDIVRLIDPEDAENEGTYTVDSIIGGGDSVLFTKPIGYGNGVDNATDSAVQIFELTFVDEEVVKALSGRVSLELEIVE